MIAISRRVARRFRAACAKCISGRPRGPAPCVVFRQANGRVTLNATFPDVTLELACGTPAPGTEVLIVPTAVLDEVGGLAPDLVEFKDTRQLKGTANWNEQGAPRTLTIDLLLPGKHHDPLPRPRELKTVPKTFLEALHEAGRKSSREDGRFALSRVQVRGASGQVIATDGKVAVIFDGFTFPFAEDVLVPAIPLFGSSEVRHDAEVRVGRTPQQFVVSSGDWTVWLGVAPVGKFPDVAGVVPRHAPTVVVLNDHDAAGLLPVLPALPGQGHEHRPVTLDASENGALAVHGADDNGSRTASSPNSPVKGPSGRAVLDRPVFARALVLGCRTLHLTPNKAVTPATPAVGPGA